MTDSTKNSLRKCNACQLPEHTKPLSMIPIRCNICMSAQHKHGAIDWDERKQLLDKLIEKHRGKADYDCIVPFSGGKDSTFSSII